MFAGYVSLLCTIGKKPLEYWSKQHSQSGRIRKILDSDLLENVIEIQDFEQSNGYGTSILCPFDTSQFLNIDLPILVVVIKNLNLKCRLQVQVIASILTCVRNGRYSCLTLHYGLIFGRVDLTNFSAILNYNILLKSNRYYYQEIIHLFEIEHIKMSEDCRY